MTETREALEQQTATAEVLQVINSSPGDLAAVLNAMLEKATGLCGAAHGNLWTYDGEHFHPAATHGSPRFAKWIRRRGPFLPEPGSTNERILQGESVIEIPDFARDPASKPENPNRRALIEIGGFRTSLSVALRKEQSLLGVLHIFRQEVRRFSEKEIALVQNFAAQAVIAMENARLLTETREALEQQTATAEVLQVINSSPGDLAPVFDAILEKAHALCGARHGYLLVRQAEGFCFAAAHDETPFASYWRQQGSFRPPEGSLLERILRGERVVHLADAMAYDGYRGTPMGQSIVESGVRTLLLLSLRRDDELLGVLTAYRHEVRPFTDKQIALLQNFAAQAVIAMENARLLTETREALEQQTATAEVLQVINSSPGDLTPVFDAMLERAIRLCAATHGHLYTYDGERFHPGSARWEPRYVDWVGPIDPYPNAPLGRIKQGERIVHVADIREEEVYRAVPIFRESVDLRGVRSQITVALLKDNILLGAMVVCRPEVRPFSDKEIALLENFAAQAVIAMENARLLTETREALEQQTATAEVLQVINSSPGDLVPVFDAMLEKATRLCEASFGLMNAYDGERFKRVASHRVPAALVEWSERNPVQFGPGTGPARRTPRHPQ